MVWPPQLGHRLFLALGFEFGQPPDHLALQLLHSGERDIEEIAGAAGRIEHFRLRQLRVELLYHCVGVTRLARLDQLPGGRLYSGPICAKRLP